MKCSTVGCKRPVKKRKGPLCRRHYVAWLRWLVGGAFKGAEPSRLAVPTKPPPNYAPSNVAG